MYLLFGIPMILLIFKLCMFYSSSFGKLVCRIFLSPSSQEIDMRRTVDALNEDLRCISAPDEPAKYIKLERRINKIKQNLTEKEKKRRYKRMVIFPATTAVIYIIQVAFMVSLILIYRNTPLYMLPPGWFYPIESVISFPSGIPGGIGVTFWTATSGMVINRLRSVIVA